jgi:integrase
MPLKVVQRHGSQNWYLRGTIRGVSVDESTGTCDRRAAEEIRARRETEVLDQSIHGRAAVATFASAAISYIEKGGERRFLKPLLEMIGTKRLSAIKQDTIDEVARRLHPKSKPSTIARQVHTPISAVMKHAAARGWCSQLPVERPRQPRGKLRWLTPKEARRLVEASGEHLRPVVLFMIYTGARVSEAINLQWDAVDLVRAHALFVDTKNGESRGVPLHPIVVSVLANLPHRDGAVFRRPDGEPYEVKVNEGGQIKTAFRGACARAKLGRDVTPHTLRHTWASWDYAVNRDLLRLMALGGWKTINMVQRYAHVDRAAMAGSLSALPVIEVGRNTGSDEIEGKKAKRKQSAS